MKKLTSIFALMLAVCQLFSANDKYRLVLTDDPATKITIGWNQITGNNPVVYYDTVDYGTNYSSYSFSQAVDRSVYFRGMHNKFVRLTGLTPNKAYYFVIHDSEGTSDRFWFKTSPDDLSRLSIIAGGDSRTNRPPRQKANLLVSKLKPHAVLFGGDMTEDDTDIQWKNWMDDWQYTIADDGRMFPVILAQGNHESHIVIYNLFDTPNESYYYAATFGDNLLRVYTLNTGVSVSGAQLDWLQNDLADNQDVIWKAAQYHRPMRPHYDGKKENEAAYQAWSQLFFDNGVRLVVESDAHTVKETWPVEPSFLPGNDEGFIVNETYGSVYIGEGGWGAPLRDNNDNKSWTRSSGKFYQFKLLFVDESKIEIRTVKTDNAFDVGEVSNDDPFTLPENLDIWSPSNGSVVEIVPAPPMNKPDIQFAENTPVIYENGDNISLEVEVLNPGNGIDNVSFYVDAVLQATINNPPYIFDYSYSDGYHLIYAVANDNTGLNDVEELNISVGSYTQTYEAPVLNGQDDVEETEAELIYFSSSDLEMMFDDYDFEPGVPNGFQKIGLRFQNVYIPAGATIESAFIQFRSDEVNSEFAEFLIYAEASADAAPFDDGDSLTVSGRTVFPDSVYWSPPAWTGTGQTGPAQKTPDVGNLLQQVINQESWAPGNDIVFKITGTGVSLTNQNSVRVADSWEGKPTHPPTLVFTYSYEPSTTGAGERISVAGSYVYPNPFENSLGFYFPGKDNCQVTVEISDILGNKVFSKDATIINNRLTIYTGIKNSGIYIARVFSGTDGEVLKQKIIRK